MIYLTLPMQLGFTYFFTYSDSMFHRVCWLLTEVPQYKNMKLMTWHVWKPKHFKKIIVKHLNYWRSLQSFKQHCISNFIHSIIFSTSFLVFPDWNKVGYLLRFAPINIMWSVTTNLYNKYKWWMVWWSFKENTDVDGNGLSHSCVGKHSYIDLFIQRKMRVWSLFCARSQIPWWTDFVTDLTVRCQPFL